LTYARILDPKSKYATWDRLNTYYEKPKFEYQHILIQTSHTENA